VAVRRALPFLLVFPFLGCAASAPRGAGPASGAEAPAPPPQGSKRLPASLDCEPEAPCGADCVTTHGEASRGQGSLDKEVIRQVIRSHVADVQACYDTIALTHSAAVGRMMVRFGIAPSGGVETTCLVSSELNDASVERCVVDLPLAWKFPKPDGGGWVVVSYPFVFTR
jgi:hypothetical protein